MGATESSINLLNEEIKLIRNIFHIDELDKVKYILNLVI